MYGPSSRKMKLPLMIALCVSFAAATAAHSCSADVMALQQDAQLSDAVDAYYAVCSCPFRLPFSGVTVCPSRFQRRCRATCTTASCPTECVSVQYLGSLIIHSDVLQRWPAAGSMCQRRRVLLRWRHSTVHYVGGKRAAVPAQHARHCGTSSACNGCHAAAGSDLNLGAW